MSAVSLWIAREYFETLGYLVSQPSKHVSPGRKKRPEEELDLIAFNPLIETHRLPDHMVWTGRDLGSVRHALVGVRGWHTERFSSSTFDTMPEILRFAEPEIVRLAETRLGTREIAKILCLPQLAASGELKEKTLTVLREKGVDGVISFRTMLVEMLADIEKTRNYEKSDLLQILRILKSYDLLKDSQMDLFGGRRRTRRASAADGVPAGETGN